MRRVYINSNIVLDIPSTKNELSAWQYRKIKEHLSQNENPDGLTLFLMLINPQAKPKIALWVLWHLVIKPWFFKKTLLGSIAVKVLDRFGIDIVILYPDTSAYEKELREIFDFLNSDEPLLIPPFTRKGIYQVHGQYFKGLTMRQFREAYFAMLQYDFHTNPEKKQNALNNALAWTIAPYWLMWNIPFVGFFFRKIFVPSENPTKAALAIIRKLSNVQKEILAEYFLGNIEKIRKLYPLFHQPPEDDTGDTSIIGQYYSIKSLTQLRSTNGMIDERIDLSEFTDIIDSYETEIHRAIAQKKINEKAKQ